MDADRIFRKCAWRLIPFLTLLYVVNFLDRVNVGFAALTMNKDLGFSPAVFGFGAGVFFAGYALFQVPANVVLERIGARRWIFCILLVWGLISASNAWVTSATEFHLLRFFLGAAEAGFVPGIFFYLTLWFPPSYRGRFIASFMAAAPLSGVVGGPLSGSILSMGDVLGLHSWQWLFLIEGLPACFLAFAVLKFLPDGPKDASFLTEAEKQIIATRLAGEKTPAPPSLWPALYDPRVLLLGLVGTGIGASIFGSQLWLPQIVKAMGYSNFITTCIAALPYAAAIPAMIFVGRSSDRHVERIWHNVIPLAMSASGFIIAALAPNHYIAVGGLIMVVAGLIGTYGPYYSLASSFFSGPAAPAAIALVNLMCTGLGGFLGPNILGMLKDSTGGYAAGMFTLSAGLVGSIIILLVLGKVMAARNARLEASA